MHLGIPKHSLKSVRAFQIELECKNVGFPGKEKTQRTQKKPLGARERANNKLNPHMASTPGFELGPQWWEASALTTAPSLSPQMMYTYCIMNCFVQKGRGISVQSVKLIPRYSEVNDVNNPCFSIIA